MGKHPPIAAPQPVSFNIPISKKAISSSSVSNINGLATDSGISKSRFNGLKASKLSISPITKWLGGVTPSLLKRETSPPKGEASLTKESSKGSFFTKIKKKKKGTQEDDELPDIPLPPSSNSLEEHPARQEKIKQTIEGGAKVQNTVDHLWRVAIKRIAKKPKSRTEEEETRKPEALPTTSTIKYQKEGVISYEEEETGPSFSPTKFPSKRQNGMKPKNQPKRRDISGLFSLEEEELNNIPYPADDHLPMVAISFSM